MSYSVSTLFGQDFEINSNLSDKFERAVILSMNDGGQSALRPMTIVIASIIDICVCKVCTAPVSAQVLRPRYLDSFCQCHHVTYIIVCRQPHDRCSHHTMTESNPRATAHERITSTLALVEHRKSRFGDYSLPVDK